MTTDQPTPPQILGHAASVPVPSTALIKRSTPEEWAAYRARKQAPAPPQPEPPADPKPGDVGVFIAPNGLKMEVELLDCYSTPPYLPVDSPWTRRTMVKPGDVKWHRRLAVVEECKSCDECGLPLAPDGFPTGPNGEESLFCYHCSVVRERDDLKKRLAIIKDKPAPEKEPEKCGWSLDQPPEEYDTSCGRSFRCVIYGWDGVPGFCPGCGRRVVVEKEGGE